MGEYSKRYAQMNPDTNFQHEFSDWIHDFEVLSVENGATYGITYPDSRICRTYLAKHETATDIMNTTGRHEPIHAILSDFYMYAGEDEPITPMDIEQEHKLIQKISWVEDEGVLEDGYFSLYNGKHIKPTIKEEEYNKLMKKYNRESDKIDECNTEE